MDDLEILPQNTTQTSTDRLQANGRFPLPRLQANTTSLARTDPGRARPGNIVVRNIVACTRAPGNLIPPARQVVSAGSCLSCNGFR